MSFPTRKVPYIQPGLREVIPSTEYGASFTLIAAAVEELIKVEISGGKGFFGGFRCRHDTGVAGSSCRDLEFGKNIDGGGWTDFFNVKAAYDIHMISRELEMARGTPAKIGSLEWEGVLSQRIFFYDDIAAGTRFYVYGLKQFGGGAFGEPFDSSLRLRVTNNESISAILKGIFLYFFREEGSTITVTINP